MKPLISISFLLFGLIQISFSQGTQLLRQPTLSKSDIVFVYANDLWKAPRQGGDGIRLTTNEGYESLPHYSPDEKWIAFSGEYGGNTDIYIIPAEGGEPKRLTWHPGGDFVTGWTPDGEVLFRSGRESHPTETNKFYTISTNGGLPKAYDLPRAAYGEISPDGNYVAYTPITSWDPEWRNYRGGQAMPIWIVNTKTKELITTPQPTKERHLDPIWVGNKIYYLSERDYASNIWMFDPRNKAEKQITFHKKFDVKSLDADRTSIVYEQGGYLYLLDPATGEDKQLKINVRGDMNFAMERWESVSDNDLFNGRISPNGKRAIFEYRGEVLTIPKENGSARNLTNSPGVADRYPIWSPMGDKIAWFSDESGEYQLHVTDQIGQNKKIISLPNPTFYFTPDWSPDSKYIAYTDTDYNLWYVDITNGITKKVATDRYAHPNRTMNPVWSPDSRYIAYVRQLESHFKAAFAYDIESGENIQLTDGMSDVISPVWDQGGKYMYILASTDYGLNSGWLDMSSYDAQVNRSLYCILLSQDAELPTKIKSDEEEIKKDKEEDKTSENSKDSIIVSIDKNDIDKRIIAIDIPSRSYEGLVSGPEKSVFILESIANKSGNTLHKYDLKKQILDTYSEGIRYAVSSSDGKKLLYSKSGSWYLNDAESIPKNGDGKLNIEVKVKIDPRAEYHQIFKEGWRYMRDFLYVNNVHGAPWDKIYEWYAPWIDHVRHRTDLNYVVDIMSGEVSIGHSYVSGGDMPDIDEVPIGLLGCDIIEENGYYKISKIYGGENWNPDLPAPLKGYDVYVGDYILAVNGKTLQSPTNPYSLFEQTAGKATTITVNSSTSMKDSKEILIKPIENENGLRQWEWIERNRKKVDELSNGKLAYVYVPNTGGPGFTYFNRMYFAQQDKKGVVIDERNNGGGSAADYMIDIMSRTLFGYFNSKANDNRPWTTPMAGIWGPKVMIINERAGSGGDLLPYMFRAKKVGPLVGTRTWGGLVGTWDTPRFIDGGRMVAPRGGFFDVDGNWAVEGEGIAPDIEVIQDPKSVLAGKDPQLEKAVEEALRLLKNNEFQLKAEPAPPTKWKRPEGFKY